MQLQLLLSMRKYAPIWTKTSLIQACCACAKIFRKNTTCLYPNYKDVLTAINKRQPLIVSSVFTTFFENLDLQYYGIGVILNVCKETKMIYIVSLYFVYEFSQLDHKCECVCVLVVCVCVLGVGWGWYAVYFSICIMFSLCRLLADKKRQWSLTLELHFLNMVSVCHLWMRENPCHHPWFVPRIQDLSTQQYQEARIFQ